MSSSILTILDYIEKTITELNFGINRESVKKTGNGLTKLKAYSDCLKLLLPAEFTRTTFADFDRHLSFMEHFFKERNFKWIMNNLDDIKLRDLPYIKENIKEFIESKKVSSREVAPPSNKIFIVHGRSYEPVKELKILLHEFSLKSIVLHEQPSGSRTIVEKLEKYSDVGYAFVILTPDDIAISTHDFDMEKLKKGRIGRKLANSIDCMLSQMRTRARQNVVLEFGYFIRQLGRDRVCCLYKGDVELPSDMHGIVYVPFKESVNEVKDKIIKELKAIGYKLKN